MELNGLFPFAARKELTIANSAAVAPTPTGTEFQYVVNAQGRLIDPAEFAGIVVKRGAGGEVVRLRDIGGVEVGAKSYSVTSTLDGRPSASIGVYQLPGSNAIETAKAIRKTMEQLKKNFPPGVDYKIVYDTTIFVEESIHAVGRTLLEAVPERGAAPGRRERTLLSTSARLLHDLVRGGVGVVL